MFEKMEANIKLFATILFIQVVCMYACTPECTCTLELTSCYFWQESEGKCVGSVPFEETYVLEVYGVVCENIRHKLSTSTYSNTIKVFHDDSCLKVPNCR